MLRWQAAAKSHFWGRLSGLRKMLLMLDYDGTLAPFSSDRLLALPYPGIREVLDRLAACPDCRLAFVTGRPVAELLPLLGLSRPVEIWGEHGGERLRTDGRYHLETPSAQAMSGIALAYDLALRTVAPKYLERKGLSVALHVRGASPAEATQILAEVGTVWDELCITYALQVQTFNGGLEIRIPGFSKADAVHTLLQETGERHAAAYLGDDFTDEDAFAALGSQGISVLVGEERFSKADWLLQAPQDVLAFLERVATILKC